jgi:AcrR family transcriptional regulator
VDQGGAADLANAPEAGEESAAPRWSGRHSPKRSRRDAILHSVGMVLRDTRLSSLTMQDIALQLGITKGNLYYYFRDKQDILYQCHIRCMEISLEALRAARAELGPRRACLRTLLVRHIGAMLENGFGAVLLTDLDNLSPPQRKRYVARRDEFEAGVRELITTGVARGEFECADIKLASLTMLGAINWMPKWYQPEGALPASAIAEGMADFLMRALEPKSHGTGRK